MWKFHRCFAFICLLFCGNIHARTFVTLPSQSITFGFLSISLGMAKILKTVIVTQCIKFMLLLLLLLLCAMRILDLEVSTASVQLIFFALSVVSFRVNESMLRRQNQSINFRVTCNTHIGQCSWGILCLEKASAFYLLGAVEWLKVDNKNEVWCGLRMEQFVRKTFVHEERARFRRKQTRIDSVHWERDRVAIKPKFNKLIVL